MLSKKQLILGSLSLALLFHFVFYFNEYGPGLGILKNTVIYLFAFGSIALILFVYLATQWRCDLKGKSVLWLFELLFIWIIICFVRSLLEIRSLEELKRYFLSNYMAISLFPVLFFIVGINAKYFYSVNRIIFIYTALAVLISLPFINLFELMLFLTYPVFFVIITYPLRSSYGKLLLVLFSVLIVIFSLTNRAGILRILLSFSAVIAFYLLTYAKLSRKWINVLVFCILMVPVISLYMGVKGQSVFQLALGENARSYSQLDPYADTRTFLYFEVFQDLKMNNAFLFGKGMNAGYYSAAFQTYQRPIVEVCFLQVLLKTGIVGFLLYISIIISAIFKALSKSKSNYLKSLGLLLVGYTIMIFIENQIAYNLLNVLIWVVIGMCHSEELRRLTDKEIRSLFRMPYSEFAQKRND
ncbi:MAG TPA: hypothetical protein PLX41_06805 [Bacteroidales bacterium]|nr:hypothetical protein [Bacteroidales bacterium]